MLSMSGFLKKELLHKVQLGVKYIDIPEEFQVLTWIKKNTSNGYLDTKYIPIDKSIIRTTVILDKYISGTAQRIMGVDDVEGQAVNVGFGASSLMLYQFHTNTYAETGVVAQLGKPYDIVHCRRGLELDGTLYKPSINSPTYNPVVHPYHLFSSNNYNETNGSKGIAGGFKRTQIFEGSTLIKDMIPVYNKTTKYYGMYDVVNKEFLPASNKTAFFGE